jgi:sulfonate transport system substrate-binding protein
VYILDLSIQTPKSKIQNFMVSLQQHIFQYSNLSIAIFCISFIASGCTQTLVSSTTESANSSTKPVSNQAQEKNNTIRLGYQKGGIIPIARQRGELERELVAQNIKVEWSGN